MERGKIHPLREWEGKCIHRSAFGERNQTPSIDRGKTSTQTTIDMEKTHTQTMNRQGKHIRITQNVKIHSQEIMGDSNWFF